MLPRVIMEIDGREYEGLVSLTITRKLDAISGGASFDYTDIWPGIDVPWPILPLAPVRFLYNDIVLLNGYVDTFGGSLLEVQEQATARDVTGQLVDVSPDFSRTQYVNVTFLQLARALCRPLGIEVINEVGRAALQRIPVVRIQPGQTAFSLLEEEARRQQVLLGPTPEGNLRIWRPGDEIAFTILSEGHNVENYNWVDDWSGRFRDYYVESQNGDLVELNLQSNIRGHARDESVTLPRMLRVRTDLGGDQSFARRRAQWEATSRAARSKTITVTCPDFHQVPGNMDTPIWSPGQTVFCNLPKAKVRQHMLVQQVQYEFGENTFGTQLTLIRPDAWKPAEPRPRIDPTTGAKEVPIYGS